MQPQSTTFTEGPTLPDANRLSDSASTVAMSEAAIPDTLPADTRLEALLRGEAGNSDPHVGRIIGNTQVIRKLAEGGMGSVYQAIDQASGDVVAVKILLPSLARDRTLVQRFFNEARAAQSIDHPNVVRTFGADYDELGNAYIVMEYFAGESLSARIKRQGRISPQQAVVIGRQIVSALGAAHARGIVHRDLKPGNIFLAQDPNAPGGETVKLLDFGVAKLTAAGNQLTCIGDVIGTPLYMAPEQCRADGNIDHRADFYALGCLLYAMVCGRPPFSGNHPSDVMCAHLQAPVPPPRMFLPEIKPQLEAAIMALVQKDPARRPQSADVVLAMLQVPELQNVPVVVAGDETSRVRATTASPSTWGWSRTLAVATSLAAVAGTLVYMMMV